MPVYDDQRMQQFAYSDAMRQQAGSQGLFSPGTTQEILSYERAIKTLPGLPLNAEERGKILAVIQSHHQRKASQYAGPQFSSAP